MTTSDLHDHYKMVGALGEILSYGHFISFFFFFFFVVSMFSSPYQLAPYVAPENDQGLLQRRRDQAS
jgi:hypothetical protein